VIEKIVFVTIFIYSKRKLIKADKANFFMSSRFIPDEIIQQIRNRADIVDVIGSYLPLKRAGSNRHKALCPFHNEKTPSFVVSSDRQTFHCFGCQKGGDIFRFVMEKESIDFPNAIHMLADKYNIVIPETAPDSNHYPETKQTGPNIKKERLYKLNEELALFFEENLRNYPQSEVALYLQQRNIPADVVANFRIGAAPDDWHGAHNYFINKGFSKEELIAGGVLVSNESGNIYDRFRNRLMFSIWNEQGRIVGFSGRSVEKDPKGGKYVNTPETALFLKSRILYALPLARESMKKRNFAILCEGQLDTIAFHRAGFRNAVAPQGTAFTDEQARMLKRYTDQLVIAFDSDSAGQKATLRSIEILLPIGFNIKVLNMPPGSDPDTIFNTSGTAGLEDLMRSTMPFIDYILMQATSQNDISTPWGKNQVVEIVLQFISKIKSPVLRSTYSSQLAHKLSLPDNAVFQELNKFRKQDHFKASKSQFKISEIEPPKSARIQPPSAPLLLQKAEAILLELALSHGTYGQQLAEALPHNMITDTPVGKALNSVISMTLNGEWEFAEEMIRSGLAETPSPEISRILTSPSLESEDKEKLHEIQEKAFADCLATIANHYRKIEITELSAKIATATGEEKQKLLTEYQEKVRSSHKQKK
jgi:DNA primase